MRLVLVLPWGMRLPKRVARRGTPRGAQAVRKHLIGGAREAVWFKEVLLKKPKRSAPGCRAEESARVALTGAGRPAPFTKRFDFTARREDRTALPLLLVVYGGTGDLLTVGAGDGGGDGAALAIRRSHDVRSADRFAALLEHDVQCVIVDFGVGACVIGCAAGRRIVFTIELSGPFHVRGLTVAADAINGDLNAVAGRFINRSGILVRPG